MKSKYYLQYVFTLPAKGVFVASYHYLFELALILLSTKVLGIITKRFALPQVVGALLAGLIMGPAMLNILQETDLGELKKAGKSAFIIALIGVLVPLAGGFVLAGFFNQGPDTMLQNCFIGVILTATSVSTRCSSKWASPSSS